MNPVDRLRDLLPGPPPGDAWDDSGVEDVAALASAIAVTFDAVDDDRRPDPSRATVLAAFATATWREPGAHAGASVRSRILAGAAPGIRRGGRRPALVLVAACALLAMSLGTVAASAPGGPLYDLRVGTEALGLPQGPVDRADAQVGRLDARIREALAAAERGDTAAVAAALRSYALIATEAAATPVADPATGAPLAIRVRAQLGVIAGIGAGDRALEAIREQSRVAARALLAALGDPGGDVEPGAGPGPESSAGPAPGTSASPQGTAPAITPSGTPRHTGDPQASPGGSPGGHPTASPSGPGGAPSPDATKTPRASGNPSATPRASAPGTGSPGGGGTGTPRPSGGGGSGGGSGDGPGTGSGDGPGTGSGGSGQP